MNPYNMQDYMYAQQTFPQHFPLNSYGIPDVSGMMGIPMLHQGRSFIPIYNGIQEQNFITDVYKNNLQEEMNIISELIDDFNYVSMDTEFPGFCSKTNSMKQDSIDPDEHYIFMKENVDQLKIIQIGITLQNKNGEYPRGTRTWQFNFNFDVTLDDSSQEAIQLLDNAGINFSKLKLNGISVEDFGESIMASGLVLNENIHWITFHSGYDFGYLLKLLTCEKLPNSLNGFINQIQIYFPNVIDLKYVSSKIGNGYRGGLQSIATNVNVKRIGTMHQAGSDSLITGSLYFKLKEKHGDFIDDNFNCILYGLNDD
ncbi:poly(A)-specific ribonuclease [Entamoeba marina]